MSSANKKSLFKEKEKKYKDKLSDIEKDIKMIKSTLKKNPEYELYGKIKVAVLTIQKSAVNSELSILSQALLNIRGDSYLNEARKEIYSLLVDFLTLSKIDFFSTLTDNQEFLSKISAMDPKEKLVFVKGCWEMINRLYELELQGKYRWSFPDIFQKLSLVIFSFLDFKLLEKTKNSDMPYYDELHEHLELLVDCLDKSAQEFRNKFELATKDVESLQNMQKILEMLKKIYNFSGNQQGEVKTANLIESTKEKIESILNKDKDNKQTLKK